MTRITLDFAQMFLAKRWLSKERVRIALSAYFSFKLGNIKDVKLILFGLESSTDGRQGKSVKSELLTTSLEVKG